MVQQNSAAVLCVLGSAFFSIDLDGGVGKKCQSWKVVCVLEGRITSEMLEVMDQVQA